MQPSERPFPEELTLEIGRLRERIAALAAEAREIMPRVSAALEALPDNPAITRIAGANAFAINRSALLDNWTTFNHDWKAQYARLSELMAEITSRPQVVRTELLYILEHQCEAKAYTFRRYAPEVLRHAEPLLRAAVALIDAVAEPPTRQKRTGAAQAL